MQLEFIFNRSNRAVLDAYLAVNGKQVPVRWVRNPRARRYILRLELNGCARVTIPRRGSQTEARRFAERNKPWLERQLHRLANRPTQPKEWFIGTEFLFRGDKVKLEPLTQGGIDAVKFGDESIRLGKLSGDLRPQIELFLRRLATRELAAKLAHFAALYRLPVRRVTVRNQRSRWGSCSKRGTISLNWRLIQTPGYVQEYIILHELCHLWQMNHSRRFWREVERVCPDYPRAERWLKQHSSLLE